MSYIPEDIKQLWKEAAQSFNAQISGVGYACLLTFNNEIRASSTIMSDTVSSKPRFIPAMGGLSSPQQIYGYQETNFTASSGFYQAETTKIIEGRVYGANKDFDNTLIAQGSANVWKFVCDKKHIPDLMRATTATFYNGSSKEFKTKLFRPPISYGLGQDVNCISFWVDF